MTQRFVETSLILILIGIHLLFLMLLISICIVSARVIGRVAIYVCASIVYTRVLELSCE